MTAGHRDTGKSDKNNRKKSYRLTRSFGKAEPLCLWGEKGLRSRP